MDINLHHAPWHHEVPSKETQELFEIFGNGFWADVCTHFFAEQVAKKNMGKRLDVGMQRTLHKLLPTGFVNLAGMRMRVASRKRIHGCVSILETPIHSEQTFSKP